MAAEARAYVPRFDAAERALHWIHATAFFALLASGLVLYVPSLSERISRRGTVKGIHLYTSLAWLVALALVVVVADRRRLRATVADFNRFDRDDRAWLRGARVPQGRFNAGQKVNAALTASFSVLFFVSGGLLWLSERDTRFRFASTILLHDGLMYVSLVLLVGHLYLSVIHPSTRHALRGIVRGDVSAEWAAAHHAKWRPGSPRADD